MSLLDSYKTRKVVLGALTSFVIVAAWVACQWLPAAAANYGTLVTGLGALYATYCGANTLQDHILKDAAAPPVEPLPPS